MAKPSYPEIDTENRKVHIPADVAGAMAAFPGMTGFYESYSFACQREYLEYVLEAKKPETRSSRIDKLMVMLQDGMEKKQNK
jgi:uncharacterized protein YdeI (YjbR/CyaY-like superfamily)